jgi:chaperonin GroES
MSPILLNGVEMKEMLPSALDCQRFDSLTPPLYNRVTFNQLPPRCGVTFGLEKTLFIVCVYYWVVNISIHMAKESKKNIQPLGDRVLIKPLEKKGESKTASGIILPGQEQNEKHERGTIIATGPGRTGSDGKRVTMEVKKGDTVWFKRGYDAEAVTVGDDELVLTSESNVLAVEK